MPKSNFQHRSGQTYVSALNVYPVKSGAAIALPSAEIDALGFAHDRRFMVVTQENGQFVSGREHGKLVRLVSDLSQIEQRNVLLSAPGLALQTAHAAVDAERKQVTVWGQEISAAICQNSHGTLNQALSDWLGEAVQLVYFDTLSERQLDPRYAQIGQQTAFSDGFPILLTNEASLAQLNAWRANPEAPALPMSRFRSNLVISGASEAFAEDGWKAIAINGVRFELVKPCVRCVFTTVDAETGERDPTQEPLQVLKARRRSEKGVLFGVNLIAAGQGRIELGQTVELLD